MNNEKIEPHVILHLKLQKKDIEEYMKSKIYIETESVLSNSTQNSTQNSTLNSRPTTYNIDNTNIFSNFKNISPSPSNSNNLHYEINETNITNITMGVNVISGANITSVANAMLYEKKIESHTMHDIKENFKENFKEKMYNLDISNTSVQSNNYGGECKNKTSIFKTMNDFSNANKNKKWLSSTNIWCFWCCHPFDTPPVSIPVSYTNNIFHVTGCYCSFECAVSHLFTTNLHENEKWYSYNLLHILRNKLTKDSIFEKINHAPPKETLQVFGGNLSIEEFRYSFNTNITYNVLHPPIVSLIPNIEIMERKNSSLLDDDIYKKDTSSMSLDQKRVDKAQQNIKLKRKEPLIDKKKTLLHYMNLKFQKNE